MKFMFCGVKLNLTEQMKKMTISLLVVQKKKEEKKRRKRKLGWHDIWSAREVRSLLVDLVALVKDAITSSPRLIRLPEY